MVDDELRTELRGAGLEPTAEFRARMDQDFDDALAGRRVITVATPPGARRRSGWMWPVLGAAAALIAVAVVINDNSERDRFGSTTEVTTGTSPVTTGTSPSTLPAKNVQMEVLTATLFGLRVGDVVDVTATIARIDDLSFGPHTFDSGWYLVPDDPSIDSCYDDMEYRGVMWGDVLIIFSGNDSSAEVMRWTVGEQDPQTAAFFLGTDLPAPERPNDIVSTEGVGIGSDANELRPPEFTEPGDRGEGVMTYSVNGLPPGDGSLPQPFVFVSARDGKVSSVLADVGRC